MNKYQYFNGVKFTRDEKTGYYLNSTLRKRIHRYIWEYHHGPIPKGAHIHHADHDKSNNDISNLVLMNGSEHVTYHGRLNAVNKKEWIRENLATNARPKAVEWHGSEEGHEWHKGQYKKYLGKWQETKVKRTCEQCNDEFETIDVKRSRFCSNKCKSKWRRESGIDDVDRECEYCKEVFKINKYYKNKYCSRECSKSHYWDKQKLS